MARQPDDRFASAEELGSALASLTLPRFEAVITGPAAVRPMSAPPEALAPIPAKTVAVIPFRNAGPPDDDYLAEGLTGDLIDALSLAKGLRVRPHSAMTRSSSRR